MSNSWKVLIIVLAVAVTAIGSFLIFRNIQHSDVVTYEVTGTADKADIIAVDSSGAELKLLDMNLPWSQDFGDFDSNYVYLYAHNQTDSGSVTATIYVNRQLFRTSTVSGAYNTAVVADTK